MRGASGCGLLIALALVSAALSVAAEESTTPLGRGEALLASNCAHCHAVGRSGDSPHATAPAFRTLSRKYKIESLSEVRLPARARSRRGPKFRRMAARMSREPFLQT